jgi:hypothetical protein
MRRPTEHSHPCIEALGASGKARHKPDQIATIVQPLIIDWPSVRGIGRALDQEDRAAGRHLERLRGNWVGRGPLPTGCDQPRQCDL